MSGLTITITDVPSLPKDPVRRVELIQAIGEHFGRATIRAHFNKAEDMPSAEAYRRAAGVVSELLSRGEMPLDLLVNMIAAVDGEP